jgi:hypothetical protein
MEPQGLVADEPTTNSSAQYYRFSPARYTHPFPTLGPTKRKPQEKSPGPTKKKNCALCLCSTLPLPVFLFVFFFVLLFTWSRLSYRLVSSRLCIFWVYRIKTKQINVVWSVRFWFVAVSISHASTPTKNFSSTKATLCMLPASTFDSKRLTGKLLHNKLWHFT